MCYSKSLPDLSCWADLPCLGQVLAAKRGVTAPLTPPAGATGTPRTAAAIPRKGESHSMVVATSPQDQRVSFARLKEVLPLPNLIQMQLESFHWFQTEGLKELFEEISPIADFS